MFCFQNLFYVAATAFSVVYYQSWQSGTTEKDLF